jgi:hypothetical protein
MRDQKMQRAFYEFIYEVRKDSPVCGSAEYFEGLWFLAI